MTNILASKARVNKEGKRTEEKKKIANIREEIMEEANRARHTKGSLRYVVTWKTVGRERLQSKCIECRTMQS